MIARAVQRGGGGKANVQGPGGLEGGRADDEYEILTVTTHKGGRHVICPGARRVKGGLGV